MINLKDNIWIEGYDDPKSCNFATLQHNPENIIFFGLARNVKANRVEGCSERKTITVDGIPTETYRNYKVGSSMFERMATWSSIFSVQGSILSACGQKYCIIFKK